MYSEVLAFSSSSPDSEPTELTAVRLKFTNTLCSYKISKLKKRLWREEHPIKTLSKKKLVAGPEVQQPPVNPHSHPDITKLLLRVCISLKAELRTTGFLSYSPQAIVIFNLIYGHKIPLLLKFFNLTKGCSFHQHCGEPAASCAGHIRCKSHTENKSCLYGQNQA